MPGDPFVVDTTDILYVVIHWTGGTWTASAVDRRHYPYLYQGDGRRVKGRNTFADNISTSDGRYAAHTRRFNTRCAGFSACAMAGGTERNPFKSRWPLTKEQVHAMARDIAELCIKCSIPVSRTRVMLHSEVQRNRGIKQLGKWDWIIFPGHGLVGARKAGDLMRALIQSFIDGDQPVGEEPPHVEPAPPAMVDIEFSLPGGKSGSTKGALEDGASWVPVDWLEEHLGWKKWKVLKQDDGLWQIIILSAPWKPSWLPMIIEGGQGLIKSNDVARLLGGKAVWDSKRKKVVISA